MDEWKVIELLVAALASIVGGIATYELKKLDKTLTELRQFFLDHEKRIIRLEERDRGDDSRPDRS